MISPGLALLVVLTPAAPVVAATAAPPDPAPAARALSVRLSSGSTSVRDDIITPLAFTGVGLELSVAYARALGAGQIEVAGKLGAGVIAERLGNRGAITHHELGAGYLRPLGATGRWSWGGSARLSTDVAVLESWDDAHGYWLASFALGPALAHQRPVGVRLWLVARGDLTLFGLSARPPERRLNKQDALNQPWFYFDRIGSGTRVTALHELRQARVELALRPAQAGGPARARWSTGLEARFAQDTQPAPFSTLFVGAFFGWGWGQ